MFEQVIDLEKQNWCWKPFEKYMMKMVISCENPSLTNILITFTPDFFYQSIFIPQALITLLSLQN